MTSRAIVSALQQAVHELGVPHPLHLHCNNLGLSGNVETALETIAAFDGLPVHLAHLQFYSYGAEGKRGFSSAAARACGSRQRREDCHHRYRPSHVRADGDGFFRCFAPIRRDEVCSSEEKHHHRRGHEWRRHRADRLSSMRASRTPCNGRADSSSFCSSRILGASSSRPTIRTGRRSPAIPSFSLCSWIEISRRLDRGLPKPALAMTTLPSIEAGVHAVRDRDDDPRITRKIARPLGSRAAGRGALADIAVYHESRIARRCSATLISCSRMANPSCATARSAQIAGQDPSVAPSYDQARSIGGSTAITSALGVPRGFSSCRPGAYFPRRPFEKVSCAD